MYTIKTNTEIKYEINKSIFICCLFKIKNKNDIKIYLNDIKEKYKNATHYCYAYILDNEKKTKTTLNIHD